MERQQFDREFKAQAVGLCEQGDVPIAQVARELGINVKLLYRWRNEAQQAGAAAFPGQGHSSDDEVRRLRRELAVPRGTALREISPLFFIGQSRTRKIAVAKRAGVRVYHKAIKIY